MNIKPFLLGIAALLLTACSDNDEQAAIRHKEIIQEIKSADKIVLASMAVTKTAKSERTDWYKIGKRIAVYSYDSYLRAFIDLSQLTPEDLVFDDTNKTVDIMLPPVQTEIIGRDMQLRKEYENIGLLRSDLDSKERARMKEMANSSFRREVESNPEFKRRLVEAAERKARNYFETLFEADGYTATVSFRS